MKKNNVSFNKKELDDLWQKFLTYAIILGVGHFTLYGYMDGKTFSEGIWLALNSINLVIAVATAIIFATYSFRFSRNYFWAILTALLGWMWGLFVPVTVGFIIVVTLKNKALSRVSEK